MQHLPFSSWSSASSTEASRCFSTASAAGPSMPVKKYPKIIQILFKKQTQSGYLTIDYLDFKNLESH